MARPDHKFLSRNKIDISSGFHGESFSLNGFGQIINFLPCSFLHVEKALVPILLSFSIVSDTTFSQVCGQVSRNEWYNFRKGIMVTSQMKW